MNYHDDPVFQAVQQINDPAAVAAVLSSTWHHWLGQTPQSIEVKPALTYYRPFDSARIVAEVTAIMAEQTEPITFHIFFHSFADPDKVRQQVEQGYELAIPPDAVLPVFAIDEWQTVVWTLPHAPCLPELTELLQPTNFCPLLIDPEDLPTNAADYPAPQLFRYVPFKRAILTWDAPTGDQHYFVKLCKELEFSQVVTNFQQIYAQSAQLSFRVPEPIAADPISRTFSMRALTGQQFTQIMCQAQPQPEAFSRVGQVLAELHHANLHPTTVWTAAKELNTFNTAMAEVKLALPHLSRSIDWLSVQLAEIAGQIKFPSSYPIHANLFGDQILYSSEQIGMVDWDTLALGDPHYDLGRLIAHYLYLVRRNHLPAETVKTSITALLASYESAITWQLDRTCLTWHITMQILLRGKISSLRKLPYDWQGHLEFVVAEAEWLLSGCSQYVTLPPLSHPAPVSL
jgi:hypothetical protein